eukprot:TRINITY_DN20177_c0_g2_i2.p1 TRINITY_DN20177_c0_g2~~TRINITY_DN20177_c0_g2_i2.p1  ORF type:complete len:424 (-),score=88.55 TRINITY_DN20177_c0_g2_i2:266-1492(-)
MLRSLVGSEMCIRDSPKVVRPEPPQQRNHDPWTQRAASEGTGDSVSGPGSEERPDFSQEPGRYTRPGDLQSIEEPAQGCPPRAVIGFKNMKNLGNMLMLWVDTVATSLFLGCSAHIQLRDLHPDISSSMRFPERVGFKPRGYCVKEVCLDCLREPCSGPSQHYAWVPALPNRATANAAVWNSPMGERLHALRPLIRRVFQPQVMQTHDPEPVVIHFRCSDSPMNLHWGYHLLKYAYYEQALSAMGFQSAGGSESRLPDILILSCVSHHVSDSKWPGLCEGFAQHLANWLRDRGHRVRIDCGESVLHDLSRMVNAEYLISGGCTSSLVYAAMLIAENRAVFPSMVAEDGIPGKEGETLRNVVAQPSMANHNYKMRPGLTVLDSTHTRLYHREVEYSYLNIHLVEEKLRS